MRLFRTKEELPQVTTKPWDQLTDLEVMEMYLEKNDHAKRGVLSFTVYLKVDDVNILSRDVKFTYLELMELIRRRSEGGSS